MKRKVFLPVLLLSVLLLPLKSQRGEEGVEVSVEDLQATPYGVSITLRSLESRDVMNMMIGLSEGQAIVRALRREKTERPMTHDLMKTFLDRNGWRVQKVVIRDLANRTFLADLVLEKSGRTEVYDARPSDAMAIGLRYGAKIYVNPLVFELQRRGEEQDKERIKPPEPDQLHL